MSVLQVRQHACTLSYNFLKRHICGCIVLRDTKQGSKKKKAPTHKTTAVHNANDQKERRRVKNWLAMISCIWAKTEIKESKNGGYNHVSPSPPPPPLKWPNPSISTSSIFWVVICWLHVIFKSAVSPFRRLTRLGAHALAKLRHTCINNIHT